MAVALEQEMRARVVEAEAEVPKAMAEAFRQGNMGQTGYPTGLSNGCLRRTG